MAEQKTVKDFEGKEFLVETEPSGQEKRGSADNPKRVSTGDDSFVKDIRLYKWGRKNSTVPEVLELINKRVNCEYMSFRDGDCEDLLKCINAIVSREQYEPYQNEILQTVENMISKAEFGKSSHRSQDAAAVLFPKILKKNPELTDRLMTLFEQIALTSDYYCTTLLEQAANQSETAENRKVLLEKILAAAKEKKTYVRSDLFEVMRKNKNAFGIGLKILEHSDFSDKNVVELMEDKPEYATQVLTMLGAKQGERDWTNDMSKFIEAHFDEYADVICQSPYLTKLASVNDKVRECLAHPQYIKNLDIIPTYKFKEFAQLYEDYAAREILEDTDVLRSKNVKTEELGLLSSQEKEIMNKLGSLLVDSDRANVSFVKYSKMFPLLVQNCGAFLGENERMCIYNLEHPEKENIGSILNRLSATEAKSAEDFHTAVDFVHRREMCRAVCNAYKDKENLNEAWWSGSISYEMAEAGIKDKKSAEKVIALFFKMNINPLIYGSSYNNFYPKDLVKMTDLEDWMYPVVKRAVEDRIVSRDNLGNPNELFAACKAWKICPHMPKAIAESVGEMPLAKRMVAGAIVDGITREKLIQQKSMAPFGEQSVRDYPGIGMTRFADQEIGLHKDKKLIFEFWKEMSRAQDMSFSEAMKTYIPDTKINRKRFTAAMLEEMKVENSADNYKSTYHKLEAGGGFEKFLAAKGEERTVVSPQQMIKLAEIKKHRDEVRGESSSLKSTNPRRRLAAKGLIPEKGKFGDGHQIKVSTENMSKFKNFVR